MKTPLNHQSKRFFASFLFLVSVIASSFAQEWRTVHDGMEYAEVTRTIENQPVRINLLRLDLKKVRLDVVHAMDAAIGTETVSSIATRHGAVAAINAGFFRLDNSIWAGDPAGILKIGGKFLSESSNDRIGLIIKNSPLITSVWFSHIKLLSVLKTGRTIIPISGINRERKGDEVVLYTPEFGQTTLTSGPGVEVSVANGRVQFVSDSMTSNFIPKNGFVISATGQYQAQLKHDLRKNSLASVQFGDFSANNLAFIDQTNLNIGNALPAIGDADYITNGVPQLIKDGKIDITWQEEKTTKSFVEARHPRTAVAKLKDGKFLMITVDGRSESSGGISLYDLAAYLLELGATDAMNLDGGGSTTMFLDGKVVNHPSDKEGERKVSDAILVTLRKKN